MKHGMVRKAERSNDTIHIRVGDGKEETVCGLSHSKVEPKRIEESDEVCVICGNMQSQWPQGAIDKAKRLNLIN